MSKPKSSKYRLLLTIRTLLKYSDKNHRMNTPKLNEYLRPYGLDCTRRVLRDTVRNMQEFGFDVRCNSNNDTKGIWIENRPLPDHELKRLIFAVATNPHLSKAQATDILQSLKPFVTVYQEPLLQGLVETEPTIDADDSLYWAYSVIHEAIATKKRVNYSIDYTLIDCQNRAYKPRQNSVISFTPKYMYHTKNSLYMVGYNHNARRVDAVNLKNISTVKLSPYHNTSKSEQVEQNIENVSLRELVPEEQRVIIYEGSVTFQCWAQFIPEIYNRFGPPDDTVVKDDRGRYMYSIAETKITSVALCWLTQFPHYGIRVMAPTNAKAAISKYLHKTSNVLCKTLPKSKPAVT